MVDLSGHEAGNGGYSQGTPKARRAFLYSEIAHRRMVAGRGILRNLGRNNNSPATGTAVLCEVDRKSLKHGDRFKIELARCLNVVLAWHPSDDMKQGRWRIVFQPLRDERRMVFDAEPW